MHAVSAVNAIGYTRINNLLYVKETKLRPKRYLLKLFDLLTF